MTGKAEEVNEEERILQLNQRRKEERLQLPKRATI